MYSFILILLASVNLFGADFHFDCSNKGSIGTNDIGIWFGVADLRMNLNVLEKEEEIEISKLVGSIVVDQEAKNFDELTQAQEQGMAQSFLFSIDFVRSQVNSRAIKYKSDTYYYFKNFRPSHFFGDLYQSYLAISKDLTKAFYVFGIEQNGGMIEMNCLSSPLN